MTIQVGVKGGETGVVAAVDAQTADRIAALLTQTTALEAAITAQTAALGAVIPPATDVWINVYIDEALADNETKTKAIQPGAGIKWEVKDLDIQVTSATVGVDVRVTNAQAISYHKFKDRGKYVKITDESSFVVDNTDYYNVVANNGTGAAGSFRMRYTYRVLP